MSELNLFQKIVEVRKAIDVFKKDTKGYGYNYVSGAQVLGTIKEKMDEFGLLLFPEMGEVTDSTYDYQVWDKETKKMKDKTDFVIRGDMTYKWVNAEKPEETLTVPWKVYGQQDDISKAYGSGLTYSERYFLLKFFGAPTDEDDPDAKQTNNRGKGNSPKASDKTLNFVNKLLTDTVNASNGKYTQEKLYARLKERIGTDKEMENWSQAEASKAIKFLQGASA